MVQRDDPLPEGTEDEIGEGQVGYRAGGLLVDTERGRAWGTLSAY